MSTVERVTGPFAMILNVNGRDVVIGDLRNRDEHEIGGINGVISLHIQADFLSYIQLDLQTRYTDRHTGKSKSLTMYANFDPITNSTGRQWMEVHQLRDAERKRALRVADARLKSSITRGECKVLKIKHNKDLWTRNIGGWQDLNESEPIVAALRQNLNTPGRLYLFVEGIADDDYKRINNIFSRIWPIRRFLNAEAGAESADKPPFTLETVADSSDRIRGLQVEEIISFPDMFTYSVINGLAIIEESEHEKGQQAQLLDTLKEVSVQLLSPPGDPSQALTVFLPAALVSPPFEEGQTVILTFTETQAGFECNAKPLTERVGKISGYLLRAAAADVGQESLSARNRTRRDPKKQIPQGFEHKVNLRISALDIDTDRQLDALERLQKSPKRYAAVWSILLANDLQEVEEIDFFGNIAGSQAEKDAFLQRYLDSLPRPFNEKQTMAFQGLRKMPRVMLIQGPGGTGKSEFATLACIPLLLSPNEEGKKNQILITSGSNLNIDDLAEQALEHTRLLFPEGREPIVIRLHSYDTELVEFTGQAQWKKKLRGASNDDFDDDAIAKLTESFTFTNLHEELLTETHTGDKRFILKHQSLGFYCKRVLGIFGNKDSLYAENRFEDIRAAYETFLSGAMKNPKDKLAFKEKIDTLIAYTMSIADVIVTTVSNVAAKKWHGNIHPCAIILDEAGRMTEGMIWALFANHPGIPIIFLGDENQTGPVVKSEKAEQNTFVAQLKLPFFNRLLKCGAFSFFFTHQHRYPAEVGELVSKHFYNSELEHAPKNEERALISTLRDFNFNQFDRPELVMFIDSPTSMAENIGTDTSRLNRIQLYVTIDLVDKLLTSGIPPTSIGICTPYKSMSSSLKHAQRYLAAKHPGAEQILVDSVDSWTGLERDVVVCPLVAGQSLGFLTARSRVCTAFTRSRIGFTFIGNLGAMRQNRDFSKSPLGTLIEELVAKGMFYTSHLTAAPEGLLTYMPSDEDVIASRGSGLKCFRCNGFGHKRADCRVKMW